MKQTSLQGIANKAAQDKTYRFRNLFGILTAGFLFWCWDFINRRASSGVDRLDAIAYEDNLIGNIQQLAQQVKQGTYRAKLVLRKWIPKIGGKLRPLGIPAIADKLLQLAVAKVLEAIYEQDFLPCSYGYRPRTGAHQAIKDLTGELKSGKYHVVVEADIKGFFNAINHDLLMDMLAKRIDDSPFLNLICKWLKAGILETDGQVIHPLTGTPQGGNASPILANIYLHYVLDEWFAYNSCRNRHCPKCQSLVRAQWLEDRQADLLPVEYFHVVFTLPEAIAAIAYQNKAVVYDILFHATAETLRTIAATPKHLGAEIGFIAILHTWGQNLQHHPHLHCVVPGGGLSADGEHWVACRPGFFLHVRVLSLLFRRLFLEQLQAAFDAGQLHFFNALEALQSPDAFARYLAPVRKIKWVVYAKPPFGGPQQVLEYLGRYTHRVAIANQRLIDCVDGKVRFHWKDYRHDSRQKVMCLDVDEFIRRFLLHVLPSGFQRIRHYGLLANCCRAVKLPRCRQLLNAPAPAVKLPDAALDYRDRYEQLTSKSLRDCPKCGQGHMICIETFLPGTLPRGPPGAYS